MTSCTCMKLLWILFFCLVNGTSGYSETGEHGSEDYQFYGSILLLVCLISMLALCFHATTAEPHTLRHVPPWVATIQRQQDVDTGFNASSDGVYIINHNCVHRHRSGRFVTDGVKWGTPLQKGKHVFEIYWPSNARGTTATIGVAMDDAPLFAKPTASLVGGDRKSWGLDIVRRRYLHEGQVLGKMPPRGLFVPDKFYMYVDCDSGTLGWGSEIEYWGAPINIPRQAFPVYAMLGIMCENAQVTMIYRGSECRTGTVGNQLTTVVVPSGTPGDLHVTVVNPYNIQTQYPPAHPAPPVESGQTTPPPPYTPGPAYQGVAAGVQFPTHVPTDKYGIV